MLLLNGNRHLRSFLKISGISRYQREYLFKKSQHSSSSTVVQIKKKLENGPEFKEFLIVGKNLPKIQQNNIPYIDPKLYSGNGRKVFFEVYGCQMNVNDTEIVWSILNENNYIKCTDVKDADVILVITCAIREGAETKIWNRLKHLHSMKKNRSIKKGPLQVGILGCMAERLKVELLEKEQWVDVISGPDSYKDLPRLLAVTKDSNQSAVNVLLSLDETYADIMPIRLNSDSITAFVSIMRGCDNMCSYCIVPFTRGKERSRSMLSIENEVKTLAANGIREITLLGQNVNSYRDISNQSSISSDNTQQPETTKIVSGFRTVYKSKIGGIRFAELLQCMAEAAPEVRFRFTSPHPKDFPDEVLHIIQKYPNICKNLHMPAQSGNSAVLERMRRGYTRESYLELIKHVRTLIPEVALSSDFICGFCDETENEFQDTLSLINEVKFNVAYLFAYSMREKTTAHRRYNDNIPENIKLQRLQEMVKVYRATAAVLQSKFVGKENLILIEGKSKRSQTEWYGRNDANIKVIIPNTKIPDNNEENTKNKLNDINVGDFITVQITESNSQVLKGVPIYRTSLQNYYKTKSKIL